ncbi:MAG: hypothetical protein KIS92_01280 [Planctomycetota bacterium]|nr:hypothetical protein [Planctomycetota bacterium]
MKIRAYGAMLAVLALTAGLRAEEPSTPANAPASEPASGGGWLKLSRTIHVDPEHQVALLFYGEKMKIDSVYKVDLAERKAVKLCDLPADAVVRFPNYDAAPRYAALTADGKTILFDKETREDPACLPDGRTCISSNAGTGQKAIVAMRRSIYALPAEGGQAKAIARNGDFNEWRYDAAAGRVIAVACENGQMGLVVLKPDGVREELVGFRRNEPTGEFTLKGQKIPHGGCMESNPVALGARMFTCVMHEVYAYTKGAGSVEKYKPVGDDRLAGMAPAPGGKDLILLSRSPQGVCQLLVWTPGPAPARPLGAPFALNTADGNQVSASSDGSALWTVSENRANPAAPVYQVQQVDPKTGRFKEFTTSAQIEDLVAKARKEAKK